MVAGSIMERFNKCSIVLSYKDESGKRRQKWYATGLPFKNNRRRAEQLLEDVKKEYHRLEDRNIPQDSINEAVRAFILEYVENTFNISVQPQKSVSANAAKETRTESICPKAGVYEQDNNPANVLFSEYIAEWLKKQKRRVELSTYINYEFVVLRKIVPYFSQKKLRLKDLTARDIHEYYDDCLNSGLKVISVLKHHSNIRQALRQAIDDELIDAGILAKLKRPQKPKNQKYRGSFCTTDEINTIFDAFKGDPMELIVKMACFYGMRRGEILGLRWSSISFDRKTFTVESTASQQMSDGKYAILLKDRTKNESSMRTFPLVDEMAQELLTQKERLQAERKKARGSYCKDFLEYVFLDPLGQLFKPNYLTQHFKLILKKNGLRVIRFHDMRHSCASLLLANGVPMKSIQEWLGHSNFSTTADIYSHLDFKNKELSANAIANSGIKL